MANSGSYEQGFTPKHNDPQSERIQANRQSQAAIDSAAALAAVRGKLPRHLADVPLSDLPAALGDLLNEVAAAEWEHRGAEPAEGEPYYE